MEQKQQKYYLPKNGILSAHEATIKESAQGINKNEQISNASENQTNEQDERLAYSQIGLSLETLTRTISTRRTAGEESYTHSLLDGPIDKLLKKVMEEAGEVALAAKDVEAQKLALHAHRTIDSFETAHVEAADNCLSASLDHLRYESADLMYHLLVVLERYDISITEFAAELNSRMKPDELPNGAVCILPEHVNRG